MKELSRIARGVRASTTMAIDSLYKQMKAEGQDVIGFAAGEPDFNTPDHIKEAAYQAIRDNFTRYTPASGMVELKQAACDRMKADCGVDYTPAASRLLEAYEQAGFGHLPVIVAKTPLSLSAEPGRKGVPTGWRLPVREVRLAAGAGYVYAICGSLSTMPGLPSRPAAERIDVDLDTGQIVGLR